MADVIDTLKRRTAELEPLDRDLALKLDGVWNGAPGQSAPSRGQS
jgi:hypothetical protein